MNENLVGIKPLAGGLFDDDYDDNGKFKTKLP